MTDPQIPITTDLQTLAAPVQKTTPAALVGISALLQGRKGVVAVLIVVGGFVAFCMGKCTWDQLAHLLEWVGGVFMAATGVEDAAQHLSTRPPAIVALDEKTAASIRSSLRPPPGPYGS